MITQNALYGLFSNFEHVGSDKCPKSMNFSRSWVKRSRSQIGFVINGVPACVYGGYLLLWVTAYCSFDILPSEELISEVTPMSKRITEYYWKYSVCHYYAINFLPNPHNRHPIVHPLGWDMGCHLRVLTHWGRVTHIGISKLTIIGSDNGLSPGRCQAIIWANARILLMGALGTNFSDISREIHTSSFEKIHFIF